MDGRRGPEGQSRASRSAYPRGGRAPGAGGARSDRIGDHQRGCAGAGAGGDAAQPADHGRRGARPARARIPRSAVKAPPGPDASVLCGDFSGRSRLAARTGEEQVRHFASDPPLDVAASGDGLALARWRLYAALEDSLRRHADHQAAVRTRMFVIAPYLPPLRSMRERLGQLRSGGSLPRGPLQRELGAHRRVVRESLAHANAVGAELSALGLPNRLLNGEEVAQLLWRRFNPTRADSGRPRPVQVSGELDAPVERSGPGARRCGSARRLRTQPRLSSARAATRRSMGRRTDHLRLDHRGEHVARLADGRDDDAAAITALGPRPRARPPTRAQAAEGQTRDVFAVNRSAEAKGRVPDFDRYSRSTRPQTASPRWPATNRPASFASRSTSRSGLAAQVPTSPR